MDDLIGLTLKGKFEITGRLGEGAMGTVFRGVDKETGDGVAIKVMHPRLMKEPGMLTRFRREAKAMRRVKHPNAVRVLGHGVDQGFVFLAMELIDGEDLAEHMAKHGRMDPIRAASIVADVASALAAAHAIGLVHRDVKPENVLLGGADGATVKLTDFGIAKAAVALRDDSADDEESFDDSIPDSVNLLANFELTTAGTLIGSPGYMAPEQWGSHGVDGRTDVYACGVMLYQLVTGRLPFEAENPFMVAAMQRKDTPAAPHVRNPKVSHGLSAIILRALKPSPEDRFQSAGDLRDALRMCSIESAISSTIALDRTVPFELPEQPPVISLPVKTEIMQVPASRTRAASSDGLSVSREVPASGAWIEISPAGLAALPSLHDDCGSVDITTPFHVRDIALTSLHSTARNGRKTPVPSEPVVSLARVSGPPPAQTSLSAAHVRFLLPLAAAFLALGVVLGILLFFPTM